MKTKFQINSLYFFMALSFSLGIASVFSSEITLAATTPSLNGSNIPLSSEIIDKSKNVWTVKSGVVYENGKTVGSSSNVTFLLYYGDAFYQENKAKNFYLWNNKNWAATTDPRKVSANETKITSSSTTPLVDAGKNVWVIVSGVVYENGLTAGFTSGVASLLYLKSLIYQENTAGNFWYWNLKSWTATSNPSGGATPTPTPKSSPTPTPTPVAGSSSGYHVAMDDIEILNPFPSWANAKTTYGAKGDGVTNDSPALQKALNDLGRTGKAGTLYLPPGTYKLESTITFTGISQPNSDLGVSIVGDSPTNTTLLWAGPSGEPMIIQNGGFNVSYSRMTLDGHKTAGYGIAQWYNTTIPGISYGGSSEHVDMVFQDMNIGIMAGRMGPGYGQLDSEGQIRRVTFLRMGYAGLDTGSWNALDWWVFDSTFVDCARGLTNTYNGVGAIGSNGSNGAGAFYVYRSLFRGSTVADITISNTAWFSMHDNVSIGSAQFFNGGAQGGSGANVIIEHNRIVNTTNPASISIGNMGPLILIDNQILSKSGVTSGVVELTPTYYDGEHENNGIDFFSTGNEYTVPTANVVKRASAADRVTIEGDTTVAANKISTSIPTMPGTPSRVTRKVFEVAANSTSTQIQTAINEAAAAANSGSVNPVVHLPPGLYNITSSLVIPAKTRMQIVGDSFGTKLNWIGTKGGNIFQLPGPSYATIRDMYIFADNQTAGDIAITNANQAGGRIFIEGSLPGLITASNLSKTQISAQENTGFAGLKFNDVANFSAYGCGGMGPITATNSGIIISDTWYEGTASALYRMTGGSLTLMGAQLNPATHSPAITPIVPAIELNNFSGLASFIGIGINLSATPSRIGIEIGTENSNTNAMFLGFGGDYSNYFDRTSSGGSVGLISSRREATLNSSSIQYANQGTQTLEFVNKMLAQIRSVIWDTAPSVQPSGSTDVRIYRVHGAQTTGLTITGN